MKSVIHSVSRTAGSEPAGSWRSWTNMRGNLSVLLWTPGEGTETTTQHLQESSFIFLISTIKLWCHILQVVQVFWVQLVGSHQPDNNLKWTLKVVQLTQLVTSSCSDGCLSFSRSNAARRCFCEQSGNLWEQYVNLTGSKCQQMFLSLILSS